MSKQIIFKGIINEPTLKSFQNGLDPAESVLAKAGSNALKQLGLTPKKFRFEIVRGNLNIVIDVE